MLPQWIPTKTYDKSINEIGNENWMEGEKKCNQNICKSPINNYTNLSVVADTDIPFNAIAGPYPGQLDFAYKTSDFLVSKDIVKVAWIKDRLVAIDTASCSTHDNTMNCVSDDVNKGKTFLLEANLWMLALQAARENHEQNVELIADEFGMPFLRVVKTIKQGDVLFLWYNESLARCVGVPILTPANIRGNQQYICTECHVTFIYPNTLKAHLIYRCKSINKSRDSSHELNPPDAHMLPSAYKLFNQGGTSPISGLKFSLLGTPSCPITTCDLLIVGNETKENVRNSLPDIAFDRKREKYDIDKRCVTPDSSTDQVKMQVDAIMYNDKHHSKPIIAGMANEFITDLAPLIPSSDSIRKLPCQKHKIKELQAKISQSSNLDPRIYNINDNSFGLSWIANDNHKTMISPKLFSTFLHDYLQNASMPLPLEYQHYFNNRSHTYSSLNVHQDIAIPCSQSIPARTVKYVYPLERKVYCKEAAVSENEIKEVLTCSDSKQNANEVPLCGKISSYETCYQLRNNCSNSINSSIFREEEKYLEAVSQSFLSTNHFSKGHLCVYCGKIYSRKYGLKIHLRTHTGYKPLKCKVCSRLFGDPSNLNKHIRLHSKGDTPYRCDYCNKVLVRRRDLERHIRSRHPLSYNSKIENEIDGVNNYKDRALSSDPDVNVVFEEQCSTKDVNKHDTKVTTH